VHQASRHDKIRLHTHCSITNEFCPARFRCWFATLNPLLFSGVAWKNLLSRAAMRSAPGIPKNPPQCLFEYRRPNSLPTWFANHTLITPDHVQSCIRNVNVPCFLAKQSVQGIKKFLNVIVFFAAPYFDLRHGNLFCLNMRYINLALAGGTESLSTDPVIFYVSVILATPIRSGSARLLFSHQSKAFPIHAVHAAGLDELLVHGKRQREGLRCITVR